MGLFDRKYTKDFSYFKAKIPKFIPENSWHEKTVNFDLSSFKNVKSICFYNNFIYETESYDTRRMGPIVTETTIVKEKERLEFIYYIDLLNEYDIEKLKVELMKEFLGLNLNNLKKSEFYNEESFLVKHGNALILKSFEGIEII